MTPNPVPQEDDLLPRPPTVVKLEPRGLIFRWWGERSGPLEFGIAAGGCHHPRILFSHSTRNCLVFARVSVAGRVRQTLACLPVVGFETDARGFGYRSEADPGTSRPSPGWCTRSAYRVSFVVQFMRVCDCWWRGLFWGELGGACLGDGDVKGLGRVGVADQMCPGRTSR
jgi:hypothetical protein